jgi:hypothetical protein
MQDSGITIKNSLQKHTLYYNLLDDIVKKLSTEIKSIDKLRLDPELTLLICNLIENSITTGNKNDIDKKELVIKILTQLFNLSDSEQAIISQQIDFLIANNKIKKVKMIKNVKNFLSALLVKKLL